MLTDVDECFEGTHNCTGVAQCENEVGSFRCSCPIGYSLDPSVTTCNGELELVERIQVLYISLYPY